MTTVSITFLGAAGTVTGSKYLVEYGQQRILVDCGIFQGDREWRTKNWENPLIDLNSVTAVLLTHAHIDHSGMLPRYYTLGLRCPIYASATTVKLCGLLLPDSGRLQEEDAEYLQRGGRSRHTPPLPLYTEADARNVLPQMRAVPFGERIEITPSISARWRHAGHILGAGSIELSVGHKRITFSGDIGRYSVPILRDPEPVHFGDLLLIESTYGDRLHGTGNPKAELARVINDAVHRGGLVLVPSFAVGRTQELLYYLRELKEARSIPDIPVIIDSPMAADATGLYVNSPEDYDEDALGILQDGRLPFAVSKLHFIKDRNESKRLNEIREPMVLISASGMLGGGRILHHLRQRLGDERNTILFVGFQPPGGKGDWIKQRRPDFRIFGDVVPINAHIEEMSGLSAHGDQSELLRWCRSGKGTPRKVAVVHGEPQSARVFLEKLKVDLGWDTFLPEYKQRFEVG